MPNEGFLDTRGKQWLAIGICDRCKRKFPLEELRGEHERTCAALAVSRRCSTLRPRLVTRSVVPRRPRRTLRC